MKESGKAKRFKERNLVIKREREIREENFANYRPERVINKSFWTKKFPLVLVNLSC